MMNGFSRETFDKLTPEDRGWLLFELVNKTFDCSCEQKAQMDAMKQEWQKIKERSIWLKRIDTGMIALLSLIGGAIGGWLKSGH